MRGLCRGDQKAGKNGLKMFVVVSTLCKNFLIKIFN